MLFLEQTVAAQTRLRFIFDQAGLSDLIRFSSQYRFSGCIRTRMQRETYPNFLGLRSNVLPRARASIHILPHILIIMRIASSLVALAFLSFAMGSPYSIGSSVVGKGGQSTSIHSRPSGTLRHSVPTGIPTGTLSHSIPTGIPTGSHSHQSRIPSGFSGHPTPSNGSPTHTSASRHTQLSSTHLHYTSLGCGGCGSSGSPAPTTSSHHHSGGFSNHPTPTHHV